jgi:DNA-binding transcriptional LysR family regulator
MHYFDPVSLRLFVAVCEERSLALAAEREAIVASAISKRLSALEDQVGVQLLIRDRRGVTLTPAGEALLRYARPLLQSMETMFAELSEFSRGVHGQVRIFASMSAVVEFLPEDIGAFVREYEGVKVSLDEKVSTEIVRGVEDGRADLGVCWDASDMRGLQVMPYRHDRLAVVVHPSHPLASRERLKFEETLDYEHIEIQSGSMVQLTQRREAMAANKAIRYRIQVTTFEAAFRFVAANLAVAVIPVEAAQPVEQALGLKVIPLTDGWTQRNFVIFMRDYNSLSVPARLLVDSLRSRSDRTEQQ